MAIFASEVRHRLDLMREEHGQGLVEYALIISVVAIGAIAGLVFLKDNIKGLFSNAGSSIALGAGASTGPPSGGGGPVITITQSPTNPTTATTATFQFTSSPTGSSYSCQLDAQPASPCNVSTNVTYTSLSTGSHTFTVTPTPAGTNGTYAWTINGPPSITSVAINNGGGTNNTLDTGDQIVVTFNQPVLPGSVCTGWTGASPLTGIAATYTAATNILGPFTLASCVGGLHFATVDLTSGYLAADCPTPVLGGSITGTLTPSGGGTVLTMQLTYTTGTFNACFAQTVVIANQAVFDPDNAMAGSGGANIASFTWSDTHF
jgi:Flp pilus assembly pilin Flp